MRGAAQKTRPRNVDEYITMFPSNVQEILERIRQVIKQEAPQAEERISYGMPAYGLHGALVYFAAFKNHIGFYAIPSGIGAFEKELAAYKRGRGSVQFPINKPIPFDLIRRIVKFRVRENEAKVREESRKDAPR